MFHNCKFLQVTIVPAHSSTRVHEYMSTGVQRYTYGNNDVNGTVLIIRLKILRVIGKLGYEKKFAIVII